MNNNRINNYNISFIKRFDFYSNEMVLRINDTIYDCSFCKKCGNYLLNESNSNIKNIMCNCDEIINTFNSYKEMLEKIPDYTSGDELEDYIEYPNGANINFMRSIYSAVLFGMTYNKDYHEKINNYSLNNIIEYTI